MISAQCSKSVPILLILVLVTAIATGQKRTSLSEGWMIRSSADAKQPGEAISTGQFQPTEWYATSVPSTVVAALVKNKVYDDPHFGMNLRKIPGVSYPIGQNFSNIPMPDDSPFKSSWWYRTEFSLPAGAKGQTQWLHFDGINFRANVWLNGQRIADSTQVAGAWRTYQFDVTKTAKPGEKNILAVEVFAPTPHDLAITFVDWNPAPPDKMMGLFRDVYLISTGPVSIRYPQVITHLNPPALDKATLKVNVELRNAGDRSIKGTAKGTIDKIEFSQPVELGPGETKTVAFDASAFPQLVITKPRVWWPAELGEQPLYPLTVEFLADGKVSDKQTIRFGVREITSEFTPEGNTLFKINGQKILIRGAGYTPEMLLRTSAQRQEDEIAYVKHMNLNTIRLEGKLENDHFFDTCDQQGILVMPGWCCCDHWERWKDWNDEDYSVAAESLESQIRRLRSHASVFVWLNGSDNPPIAKVEQMYLDILKKLDWPNPVVSSATQKKADVTGPSGVKMSGPYEYVPPSYWLADKKNGGAFSFATEISPGPDVPPVESIKLMLPPDHLWPIDEYWNYHCGGGAFKDLKVFTDALTARFGTATSLEDYVRKAQALAYESHRAMFEGYARNKYVSTGVIQWMQNNAWPSMIWHLYDFYLRPGGTYFATKLACEPVHIQYSYDDRSIVVVNSLYKPVKGLKATAQLLDFDLKEKFSKTVDVSAEPDSAMRIFNIPEVADISTTHFLRLTLTDASGQVRSSNFYWLSTKPDVLDDAKAKWYYTPCSSFADFTALQSLPEVQVKASVRYEPGSARQVARVTVENPSKTLAFMVRLQVVSGPSGDEVLPVFWDDNYFSLLPGEKRVVSASYRAPSGKPKAVVSGWNVQRQELN